MRSTLWPSFPARGEKDEEETDGVSRRTLALSQHTRVQYIADPTASKRRRDRFVTALLVPADERAIGVRESLLPLLTARRERRGTGEHEQRVNSENSIERSNSHRSEEARGEEDT